MLANSPAAFAAWWEFQVQLEDSELVRQQVAVLAADVDQCGYRLGTTSTNSAAALEFAAAVVTGRGAISKDAIAAAHAGGLSDTQLIEVVAVVTLNTFLTVCGRLANPEAEPTSVGAEDDFIAMRGGSLIRHPWWLAGG